MSSKKVSRKLALTRFPPHLNFEFARKLMRKIMLSDMKKTKHTQNILVLQLI